MRQNNIILLFNEINLVYEIQVFDSDTCSLKKLQKDFAARTIEAQFRKWIQVLKIIAFSIAIIKILAETHPIDSLLNLPSSSNLILYYNMRYYINIIICGIKVIIRAAINAT